MTQRPLGNGHNVWNQHCHPWRAKWYTKLHGGSLDIHCNDVHNGKTQTEPWYAQWWLKTILEAQEIDEPATIIVEQSGRWVASACLQKDWSWASQTLQENGGRRYRDRKLALHQILLAVRKMMNKNEGKNGKFLHPRIMSLMCQHCFFSWELNTRWPSSNSCGTGFFCTKLTANNVLCSMSLPAMILSCKGKASRKHT